MEIDIKIHYEKGRGYQVYRKDGCTCRRSMKTRPNWVLWLPEEEFDPREGSSFRPYFDTVKQAVAAAKKAKDGLLKDLEEKKDIELRI